MSDPKIENFDAKQWYISHFEMFENSLNGRRDMPFHEVRKAAIARFSDLDFPTPRDEEWKYTNIAPLLAHRFQLSAEPMKVNEVTLSEFLFPGVEKNRFIFINGHFLEEPSNLHIRSKGLIVENLNKALADRPELIKKYLARVADFENDVFTALNTAFTNEGTLLFVEDGTVIDQPIHFVNISDARNGEFVAHPRNLMVMGKNSQVQIIESFHHLSDAPYFNNTVSEIVLEENARLEYIKIQEESERAFHFDTTQIDQERNSVYYSVNIDLGGGLVRNNQRVLMNDENCETHLFGFFLGGGNQHIDNHTFLDHAKPRCFSNEMFKGILYGKAKAVFNGKILVRPDAQKTNALQSNKTLLLTNDASVNAKPQLEIFADDVKCTHGATIGQLDDEALFYLRARGISEDMALAMLRYAFVGDVFENIKIDSVRKKMDHKIIKRLKTAQAD